MITNANPASIVPFSFEGAPIRVFQNEHGEPSFVAKDVAETLGYTWKGGATIAHVPGEWRGVYSVQTPSAAQEMLTLSEQGLYYFLARSDKPKALPFQKWLAGEVLPSIRKTGAYSVPNARPALLLLRMAPDEALGVVEVLRATGRAMLEFPGVKPEIIAAFTLSSIEKHTGVPTEGYRHALPANVEPTSSMNATQLGKELGLSARDVNQRLAQLGLHFRNARGEWELTEAGKAHGEALPFATGRHSGYQVLWKCSALDMLRISAAS